MSEHGVVTTIVIDPDGKITYRVTIYHERLPDKPGVPWLEGEGKSIDAAMKDAESKMTQ